MIGGNVPNRQDLEQILDGVEPDVDIRKTVLGTYDAVVAARAKFNTPGPNFKPDGVMIYVGPDPLLNETTPVGPDDCRLVMEPLDHDFLPSEAHQEYSVQTPQGKDLLSLAKYYTANGAIDIDSKSGKLRAYKQNIDFELHRNLGRYVPMIEVKGRRLVDLSKTTLDLKAREEIAGTGGGTRHTNGYKASAVQRDAYMILQSRQTGIITIFHEGKVLHSELPQEIDPVYRPFMTRQKNEVNYSKPQTVQYAA